MIDCAVSYYSWNIFLCYILLFIDIKAFATDYLYLINFLLRPICAMIIVFLLVHIITSQKIGVNLFSSHLEEYITVQYWRIHQLQIEVQCCFKFNPVNIWKITHYRNHFNHQP